MQSTYFDVDTHKKEINWSMLMAVLLVTEIFILYFIIKM